MTRYRTQMNPDGSYSFHEFESAEDKARKFERLEEAKADFRRAQEEEEAKRKREQDEWKRSWEGGWNSGSHDHFGDSYRYYSFFGGNTAQGGKAGATLSKSTVSHVFRRLAIKWHPDKGGSTEAMQALNEAHDELKKLL